MINLESWITEKFPVKAIRGDEVQFECPECGHDAHYFNLSKRISHCFRASCQKSFNLKELQEIAGDLTAIPNFVNYLPISNARPQEVKLPETARPITEIIKGHIEALDKHAALALSTRNLSLENIHRFNISADQFKIYVPVYDEGKLVQYVGRSINRNTMYSKWFDTDKRYRYEYASNVDIGQYILGWGEAKYWKRLTLVENTFVSIWLRNHFECSTNFGSNLSSEQVDKIIKSKVESVVLMWDDQAEKAMVKALNKLKKVGISTCCVSLPTGQPDDYSLDFLKGVNEEAHKNAINKIEFLHAK